MQELTRACRGASLAVFLAACSAPAGIDNSTGGAARRDAQVPIAGQTASTGIQMLTVTTQGLPRTSQQLTPALAPNAKKVYGNLAEGGTAYDYSVGYSVSPTQDVGLGFVPGANYTITSIALALTHAGGPNVYKVSLHADSLGLPGTTLRAWTISNVAPFGTCCALAVVRSWSALPVQQGVLYWVVASPESKTSYGAWNWNSRGALGPITYTNNGIWLGFTGTQSAFAVYGMVN
jgi:hypothetical protein